MKVLVVHNRYVEPGGEDEVFEAETALLESRGHAVLRYEEDNDRIAEMGRLEVARRTLWSRESRRSLEDLLLRERPDVAHFHNTFPLVSPAAYWAAAAANVPVVQTLHNYRLMCANAQLFRDGGPCEECVGRLAPWPGILYGCYRGDRAASAVVAGMLGLHRALGTWARRVDRYLTLTRFARDKMVEGGFPAERIRVKPNFLPVDPGPGEGRGGYALYVGRLSPEKGIGTLVEAWERLDPPVPLQVVGQGSEAPAVEALAARRPEVRMRGRLPRDEVAALMRDALVLVVPSRWYEGFPLVVVEALAAGLPVIASDLGSLTEVVRPGETGWRVPAGDPAALAAAVARAAADPTALIPMRRAAREDFKERYTAERGYTALMEIYREVARNGRVLERTEAVR
ncbi:MAG TPA: glycosyltransferase [Gemmatimonadota bacterium]|nr:glycosyltransferase [Gemmatimonadota bacterium]